MKKLLYTYLGVGLLMLNMTSCEDFLDSSSPSEATPDFVFSDASTARGALMEAYEKWRAKAYVHANGLFYDLVVCVLTLNAILKVIMHRHAISLKTYITAGLLIMILIREEITV